MIRYKPKNKLSALWLLCLCMMALSPGFSRGEQLNIGVVGDGFVLGSGASDDFALDPYVLWTSSPRPSHEDHANLPMKRLWPLSTEFMSSWEWIWNHLQQSASMKFVDREDLSFTTIVARELAESSGSSPESGVLYVAGQQYASSQAASTLVKRVISQAGLSGLDFLLVSFSGFELCQNLPEGEATAANYLLNIETMLKELEQSIATRTKPTKVVLFGPMPMMDILVGDVVASKQVPFYGSQQTCREVRSRRFVPTSQDRLAVSKKDSDPLFQTFSRVMPQSLSLACPAFASNDIDEADTQARIANTLRSFREGLSKLESQWSERAKEKSSKIELRFVDSLALAKLVDSDVSNDCLHLSATGHKKIADLVVSSLSLK